MTLLNHLLAKISDDKIPLVLTFHPFNYKVRDVISRSFLILKNDPETSAGTFSCSHARCYMCLFLNSATSISGPKSNFVIWHNFTCTSSNIIYCISCSKCCKLYIGETGQRLSDRFAEHLRSVRNNDVDKPVARHFNAANHSMSDMKICAISPISGGNDSRKRHEKHLICKLEPFIPTGLMNDFFYLITSLHSFRFCPARVDKSVDFSPFHSIVYVHHLPLIYFAPPPRLLIDFKNSK